MIVASSLMCHMLYYYIFSCVFILYLNWMEMPVFEIIFKTDEVKLSFAARFIKKYLSYPMNTLRKIQ